MLVRQDPTAATALGDAGEPTAVAAAAAAPLGAFAEGEAMVEIGRPCSGDEAQEAERAAAVGEERGAANAATLVVTGWLRGGCDVAAVVLRCRMLRELLRAEVATALGGEAAGSEEGSCEALGARDGDEAAATTGAEGGTGPVGSGCGGVETCSESDCSASSPPFADDCAGCC